MGRKKPKTKELAQFLKEQDRLTGAASSAYTEFTDILATFRLRICVILLMILLPLFAAINYFTQGITYLEASLPVHLASLAALSVFFVISFIPQANKNAYAFTVFLAVLMGVHTVFLQQLADSAWMEALAKFSIFIFMVGFLMPWGGLPMTGLCIPLYLFYPLCIYVDPHIEIYETFSIRSNLYLISFSALTVLAASIHERIRKKEFSLKKMLEQENTKLQDYQIRLQRAYQRMEKLALLDQLTSAYNRVYLTQWLKDDVYKHPDCNRLFSVIMFDIDHFKDVNDQEGHQKGDATLRLITMIAKEKLPEKGMIFRYGGDEFCIMLPEMDLIKALRVADNIRYAVEQHPELFIHKSSGESAHLSLSLGVTTHHVNGTIDADYLIRWVDAALMESKRQGRNCINVFDPNDRRIVSAVDWVGKSQNETD